MSDWYLNAQQAKQVDERLMSEEFGYTLEQLMELAGLAVAMAVHDHWHGTSQRVFIICGPGNNGGDGLVAARHLAFFGHQVRVYCCRPLEKAHFLRLRRQAEGAEVEFVQSLSEMNQAHVIVDAIFGFSFKGPVRPPYDNVLRCLRESPLPVVAVDIPSGWDVEAGPLALPGDELSKSQHSLCYTPAVLVSLSAPKKCALHHRGAHYVGGRFIPPSLAAELSLPTLPYQGSSQILRIN